MPLIAQQDAWKENLRGTVTQNQFTEAPGGLSLSYMPDNTIYQMESSAPSTPNNGAKTFRMQTSFTKDSPAKKEKGNEI